MVVAAQSFMFVFRSLHYREVPLVLKGASDCRQDGQDIFFAAMSVYELVGQSLVSARPLVESLSMGSVDRRTVSMLIRHLGLQMGSASPSPYCYSCISLQSTKNPSKTITAVVADSCPA